jgi:hypothetical protein
LDHRHCLADALLSDLLSDELAEFRMLYHAVEFPAHILFDSDQCREMGIGLGELVSIAKPATFV